MLYAPKLSQVELALVFGHVSFFFFFFLCLGVCVFVCLFVCFWWEDSASVIPVADMKNLGSSFL